MSEPAANTDRELYREDTGDPAGPYYENSVHVTGWGDIAMSVGGTVITRSIGEWHALAASAARPDAAELTRHLVYLLGQYERVIAMVRHIRMDTPEDRELSERVVAVMEEGAAPVRRVLNGGRSDLVARPDAATLREQIERAVRHGDQIGPANEDDITERVMAVLAEREQPALEVLAELVRLKDGPRDERYRADKERAWEQARAVLAEHGLVEREARDG